MKRYDVVKNGVVTNSWTDDKLPADHYEPCFGLPERDELDAEGNPTGVRLPAEYQIVETDITFECCMDECMRKRRAEYPSPEEYLNALFDGGEAAVLELKARRLAIKAKFPKPTRQA